MAQKILIYRFKDFTVEKTTPTHIITKLLKNKGKEKILPEKKGTLHSGKQEYK